MNSATAGGVEVTLPPGHRITRFYTLARRFPTLIGRLPNGSDIPYGPYTVGQFVTAVCLLVVGYRTMPVWGGDRGLFVNGPLLLGVTAAVVIVMRKVPWRGRGPVPVLRGMLGSYSASEGTYRGKPLPARQATPVMSGIVIAGEAAMSAADALVQQRRPVQVPSMVEVAPATPVPSPTPSPTPPPTLRTRVAGRGGLRGSAQALAQAGASEKAATLEQSQASTRAAVSARSTTRASTIRQDATSAPHEVTESSTGPLTGVQRLRQQARATATAPATTTDSTAGSPARPLTTAGSTGRH